MENRGGEGRMTQREKVIAPVIDKLRARRGRKKEKR